MGVMPYVCYSGSVHAPEVTDQVDFTHYTDAPVQLAVDLVNTRSVTTGADRLADLDALRAFLAEHGEPGGDELGPGDLEAARALREGLRAVFEAPDTRTSAACLNRHSTDGWMAVHFSLMTL